LKTGLFLRVPGLALPLHCRLLAMTPEDLKAWLRSWAVDAVSLCARLRTRPEARHLADQLLASATSSAANYRAACRARTRREFIAKLGIAVEEADESVGWLEILRDSGLADRQQMEATLAEARQLLAILAASVRTASRREPTTHRR
jgi:four helix bundle protein